MITRAKPTFSLKKGNDINVEKYKIVADRILEQIARQ